MKKPIFHKRKMDNIRLVAEAAGPVMNLPHSPIPGWYATPFGPVASFMVTSGVKYGGDYLLPGNPIANELGFDGTRFSGWLWRFGKTIYICNIEAYNPGKGHFSELLKGLFEKGYTVRVPTPLLTMTAILRQKRFRRKQEWDRGLSCPVEVWEKKP